MTKYQTTERLPHSPQQMFDLVADVERYCDFMPLCARSVVTARRVLGDGREELTATLEVLHAKTGLGGQFDSLVHVDRDRLEISAASKTGPVKSLINKWRFEETGEGHCTASFSIEYEMRSWPMQVLMNRVYERAFQKIATAFRERARQVYG